MISYHFTGRLEAREAVKNRTPSLTSKHFIQQYFQSFSEDPIMQSLKGMGDRSNMSELRQDRKQFLSYEYTS